MKRFGYTTHNSLGMVKTAYQTYSPADEELSGAKPELEGTLPGVVRVLDCDLENPRAMREAAFEWLEGNPRYAFYVDRELTFRTAYASLLEGMYGEVVLNPSGNFYKWMSSCSDFLEDVGRGGMRIPSQNALRELDSLIALQGLSAERTVPKLVAIGLDRRRSLVLAQEGLAGSENFESADVLCAPPEVRLDLLLKGGSALALMHDEGLIHSDVKPGNLVTDLERVMLVDFGHCDWNGADNQFTGDPDFVPDWKVRGPDIDIVGLANTGLELFRGTRQDRKWLAERRIDELLEHVGSVENREDCPFGSMQAFLDELTSRL